MEDVLEAFKAFRLVTEDESLEETIAYEGVLVYLLKTLEVMVMLGRLAFPPHDYADWFSIWARDIKVYKEDGLRRFLFDTESRFALIENRGLDGVIAN